MDFNIFKELVEINVYGTLHCSAYCAYYMTKNKDEERGVIINVSSVSAFEAGKGMLSYGASKAAVAAMTLPMARDLARYKIWVVCIAPGVIDTPMS